MTPLMAARSHCVRPRGRFAQRSAAGVSAMGGLGVSVWPTPGVAERDAVAVASAGALVAVAVGASPEDPSSLPQLASRKHRTDQANTTFLIALDLPQEFIQQRRFSWLPKSVLCSVPSACPSGRQMMSQVFDPHLASPVGLCTKGPFTVWLSLPVSSSVIPAKAGIHPIRHLPLPRGNTERG
jgi:hypothetical protein